MKASYKEFVVGRHGIGYISSSFLKAFGVTNFEERPMPTYQILKRSMNDAEIEDGLKVGLCDLGDVLAFLDNAPEECKDGYANLFYTKDYVVAVNWDSVDRNWNVVASGRYENAGPKHSRVFTSTMNKKDVTPLKGEIKVKVVTAIGVCVGEFLWPQKNSDMLEGLNKMRGGYYFFPYE